MIFTKDAMYKIVEFPQGLIIMHPDDNLQRPDQVPLIIAGSGHLIEYLDRYIFEREKGTVGPKAHELALQTAEIATVILDPNKVNRKPKL